MRGEIIYIYIYIYLYRYVYIHTPTQLIQEMLETLARLGLADLPARFPGGFDAVQDWSRVLSGGEQQRLAAARCLVARPAPALVVLDEATSALPVRDEANLYALLRDRGLSYISVGHRESLVQFHDLVLELQGEGRWQLLRPSEYLRPGATIVILVDTSN